MYLPLYRGEGEEEEEEDETWYMMVSYLVLPHDTIKIRIRGKAFFSILDSWAF